MASQIDTMKSVPGVENLYIRNDKTYYVIKSVGGRDRRGSTKIPVGKDGLKHAIKQMAAIEARWETESTDVWKVPTCSQWADTYEDLRRGKDADATLKSRRTAMANAQGWGYKGISFGNHPLNQVGRLMAELYLVYRGGQTVRNKSADQAAANGRPRKGGKLRPISAVTLQNERQSLQAIFQAAIDMGVLPPNHQNPFANIDRLPQQATVREGILEPADELLLIPELTPTYQRWLQFMLYTGLRINEAIHVLPEHINREAREIQVLGSITVNGKKVNVAKRGKARKVPLWPEALAAVDAQLIETPGRLWPATASVPGKMLRRAAVRAGIPNLTPHTLRHTFGTRFIVAGGDIYLLSKVLGHASVQVTQAHYAHVPRKDATEIALKVKMKPVNRLTVIE